MSGNNGRRSSPANLPACSPGARRSHRTLLLKLLAFCVAQTVNGVQLKVDRPGSDRFAQTQELGQALNLDMAAWFTPTAANYFSRISKAAIIEALREVKGAVAPAWSNMKKADLAALAEREVAGKNWLPELLRAPEPEAAPIAKAA
jgi:ParB family transcriptional regulator, chromosome partitioning protein